MTKILVTGATGYVGGRLVPLLLDDGHEVVAAGRSAAKITARPWGNRPNLTPAQADVFDPASLEAAMDGCEAAYYLVHSMGPGADKHGDDFASKDRTAAENFLRAAEKAGVKRIIYLGGLGDDEPDGNDGGLSEHLRSRAEVGRILQSGTVPTTWLRAAVILGSGSASFEILRYLTDRLPVMICPRWVDTVCQPIAIQDVLGYLTGCLDNPETAGRTLDIGGPDVLTYRDLFQLYAKVAGLRKRLILGVPVLTPKLSAHWVNLITPVPMSLIRPLIDGLRNTVVVRDDSITRLVPRRLLTCEETLTRAVDKLGKAAMDSWCHDAGQCSLPEWVNEHDASYAGGDVLECSWRVVLAGTTAQVWKPVSCIGGNTGWYFADGLWRVRGFIDKLLGGPGLRRGRRHPTDIRIGDALDFWRVLDVDKNERLLLLAEMKLPGQALLNFTLTPKAGSTELIMRPQFLPRGIVGLGYWWLMYPFHIFLFRNMLKRIARAAEAPVTDGPERIPPER